MLQINRLPFTASSISPPAREDRQQPSAWSRKEPSSSSSRDEYSKYGNNLPLQLTPPPQRREIEVVRVAAPSSAAPAGRFTQPRADNIKPFKTSESTVGLLWALMSKLRMYFTCYGVGQGVQRNATYRRVKWVPQLREIKTELSLPHSLFHVIIEDNILEANVYLFLIVALVLV